MNPHFVAYARAHGNTPDEQLATDRVEWPGGIMAGYMLWISDRWSEWNAEKGHPDGQPHSLAQHAAFDEWLQVTSLAEPRLT